MNAKLITGLALSALLTSTLLAYGPQNCDGQGPKGQNFKQGKMYKGMYDRSSHHKGRHGFIKMVMKLDLSDKQRDEIRTIVRDSMKNMPNPNEAFSESSFDKEKFIELAQAKRDAKIQHRADMMEKVYAVLNSSQKKDLKTMLDMKRVMKKNMMNKMGTNCNSKNCPNR
ncbi:Spy/CpxP family protein refolding chaperone [Sulfurimonas sp.]|uniref:Spy/CpxP family protein refolding chaperone n=1 Tax=Sulfurimonas sp. TaxID=2022749 RepID=UPI0035693200